MLIIDGAKLSEQLNLPGRETNVTGVEFCTRTRLYSQVFVVVRTGLVQSYVKKNHRTRQSPRNYEKITEHLTDFTVTLSQVEDEKQFPCFPGKLTVRTAQFHNSFHQNSLDSQEYPAEQLGFAGVSIRTARIPRSTKIFNIIRSNKNSSSFPGLTCLTNTFLSEHLPVAASVK